MKSNLKRVLLSACLAAAGLSLGGTAFAARQAAADTSDKDAARQTTPDRSPQAAYQRKVKEIRAAHRDNLANCKSQPSTERGSCVKEANQILKSDLADAKSGKSSDQSSGSSTTGEQSSGGSAK